ncbi:MAG: dUTP diphosphatase [Chitinivibrionales bacterium]|nr:dUTP diphosphatase [Chitinivibrionales bacterium]
MNESSSHPQTILVKRLAHGAGIALPVRMTAGASGFDLAAATEADVVLQPLQRAAVPTGFCFEIPAGLEVQIRPRSGLALKQGVTVLNTPGTIDSDYRGEVKVILVNLSDAAVTIKRGDRIAQAVPAQVVQQISFKEESQISETHRSSGGFGHTGI